MKPHGRGENRQRRRESQQTRRSEDGHRLQSFIVFKNPVKNRVEPYRERDEPIGAQRPHDRRPLEDLDRGIEEEIRGEEGPGSAVWGLDRVPALAKIFGVERREGLEDSVDGESLGEEDVRVGHHDAVDLDRPIRFLEPRDGDLFPSVEGREAGSEGLPREGLEWEGERTSVVVEEIYEEFGGERGV